MHRFLALALLATGTALAQPTVISLQPVPYRIYTDAGDASSVGALVEAMGEVEVIFLGEMHDDGAAHALQRRLLVKADLLAEAQDRPLVVSLEMFERDVQGVLDEYLTGLIRPRDFLDAARPWSNYAADYRPLVDYARRRGVPVVAANAPQRYVSRVSRLGPGSLDSLSAEAKATLPPLPVAAASPALAEQFAAVMEGMAGHGSPARHHAGLDRRARPRQRGVPREPPRRPEPPRRRDGRRDSTDARCSPPVRSCST